MKCWLLGVALLSGACQKAAPPTSSGTPLAERSDAGKNRLIVDRQLLTTGRIKLSAIAARSLSGELRVAGEVRSNESGSAEAGTLVAGRVASLEVAEGAKVKRGQVLAWV